MSRSYKILHPLEGGPAVSTYLVEDQFGKKKALRLYPSSIRDSNSLVSEFSRFQALTHPALAQARDLILRGRRPGVVLDFIDQAPLSRHQDGISFQNAANQALRLALLLSFLHHRSIFIGYLTPSKIFLTPKGLRVSSLVPALKAMHRELRPESTGYCAPEFLTRGETSSAADVYSLGLNLYFLFTGSPPFAEKQPDFLFRKQLSAMPVDVREINPDIPPRLASLIFEMIVKEPSQRIALNKVIEVLGWFATRKAVLVPGFRPPLIGREKETRAFQSDLGQGRARCWFLAGTSGVGKTFLAKHLAHQARLQGFTTLSVSHGRDQVPEATFRPLWDEIDLRRIAPAIQEGDSTQTVLTRLRALCAHSPLLLRVSDLQWADENSIRVYHRLVADKAVHPFILLADYRSERPPAILKELLLEWKAEEWLAGCNLTDLSHEATRELIGFLLGRELETDLVNLVYQKTGGRPYYVIEFLRFLKIKSFLLFDGTRWVSRLPAHVEDLPDSVSAHLTERLASLEDSERELLEILALCNENLGLQYLAKIRDCGADNLLNQLQRLERLEFVTLTGGFSKARIDITHDWLRKIIITALPRDRAQTHHFRISEVLDKEHQQGGSSRLLVSLTKHLLSSGQVAKASNYFAPALAILLKDQLYASAAMLYSDAINKGALRMDSYNSLAEYSEILFLAGRLRSCSRLLEKHPWPLDLEQRASLSLILGRALMVSGHLTAAFAVFEDGWKTARKGACEGICAKIAGRLFFTSLHTKKRYEVNGRAFVNRIVSGLKEPAWQGEKGSLFNALALFSRAEGLPGAAIEYQKKAVRASLASGFSPSFCGRLCNLIAELIERGFHFPTSDQLLKLCLRISDIGLPQVEIYAETSFISLLRSQGRHSDGISRIDALNKKIEALRLPHDVKAIIRLEKLFHLAHTLDLRENANSAERAPGFGVFLGVTLNTYFLEEFWAIQAGAFHKVLKLTSKKSYLLEGVKFGAQKGYYFLLRAEALFRLGHLDESLSEVRKALRCFTHSFPYYRSVTRLLLARIFLARSELSKSRACVRQALDLAKQYYYPPVLAEGYALKALILLRMNRPRKAHPFSLRAQQVARKVERPLLHAQILHVRGQIQEDLGHQQKATELLTSGVQLLRDKLSRIPEKYHGSFSETYIEPIERDLDRLSRRSRENPSRFFIQLRDFSREITSSREPVDLVPRLAQTLNKGFPRAAIVIYTRSSPNSAFELQSSSQSAANFRLRLDRLALQNPPTDPILESKERDLIAVLKERDFVYGVVAMQRSEERFSEREVDFISCLTNMLNLKLAEHHSKLEDTPTAVHGLSLNDGRVIVGSDPAIRRVFGEIKKVAPTSITVLLEGESGTGKELAALALHQLSRRASGPFVPINCASIPEDLIESELFGHQAGSFTGANRDKPGLIETASGGTLFLDEISSMPTALQPRLLRVLQEGEIRRLGENRHRKVDVRVVAASNRSLRMLVQSREFRADLYHRVNAFPIRLPALRDRPSDLGPLTQHFLQEFEKEHGRKVSITREAVRRLKNHSFPGNIRELRNLIESLFHLCTGDTIHTADVERRLKPDFGDSLFEDPVSDLVRRLESGKADFWKDVRDPFLNRDLSREAVREIISRGLEACEGNYRRLVKHFGMKPKDYKRLLHFLSRHDCKVDFRKFR